MPHDKTDFSWRKRLKSFRAALAGLKRLFLYQHNARIHLAAVVLVLAAGIVFDIGAAEWLAILLAIALVFVAELINSAVEELADVVSPGYDDRIGRIKDYCAGAVLVAAMASIIVGLVVFLPKLLP